MRFSEFRAIFKEDIPNLFKIHSGKVVTSTQQEDLTHHRDTEIFSFQETGLTLLPEAYFLR